MHGGVKALEEINHFIKPTNFLEDARHHAAVLLESAKHQAALTVEAGQHEVELLAIQLNETD